MGSSIERWLRRSQFPTPEDGGAESDLRIGIFGVVWVGGN